MVAGWQVTVTDERDGMGCKAGWQGRRRQRREYLSYCQQELPGGGIALGGVGGELTGDGDDGRMTDDGDNEWWMTQRVPGCSDRQWCELD